MEPGDFVKTIGPGEKPKQLSKWTASEKIRVYEALRVVDRRAPGLILHASNGGNINLLRSRSKSTSMVDTSPGAVCTHRLSIHSLHQTQSFDESSDCKTFFQHPKVWLAIWQNTELEKLTGPEIAKQCARNCQISRQEVGNLLS